MTKTAKKPSKAEAIKALRVAKAKPVEKTPTDHFAASVKQIKADDKKTAAKLPDDLTDPAHPLNRTNGKTKAEIDAKLTEILARDKSKHVARGITSPAPKLSTLTAADHKAIAELQSAKQTADVTAKKQKPAKLPRQLKVAKPLVKKAGEKGDTVFRAGSKKEAAFKLLRLKAGATQPELHKLTGWPHTNVRELAQQSKMKLVEKDGRFWLQ
jgi:hypothetical protein